MKEIRFLGLGLLLGVAPGLALAQDPLDAAMDAMRPQDTLSVNDHERISEWVRAQIDQLSSRPTEQRQAAALKEFPAKFKVQYDHRGNKEAFRTQLAVQTARVAAEIFKGDKQDPAVARAMARVLADMNRVETLPGLLAGLKSADPAARVLSASSLARLRSVIAADKEKLEQTVAALREAGMVETSPVAVGQIYYALSLPGQAAAALDAYLAIFEKRLEARKKSPVADGAEIYAFEYLRNPSTLGALNDAQKSTLAKAVATFMRLDAERYNSSALGFEEQDHIERTLDAEEEILTALAPGKTGKVREELAAGGHERRAEVLKQVYAWVGNPETKEPGLVNGPPLNVPIGAP